MATKPTAPAVPVAPITPPPAADTGAGTSADKSLLDQLTGDDGPGDLPPASEEPKADSPAPVVPNSADTGAEDEDEDKNDHKAYENTFPGRPGFNPETASSAAIKEHTRILEARMKLNALTEPGQQNTKPAPGSVDFDAETATEDELDAHLRMLEKKDRIRKLTLGEQPAAPAPAAIASASAPVPMTIVAAAAPATFTAPSAKLIGKYDSVTGLVQQLPQKLWDQLSPEDAARFTDIPVQPEKPASLI